MIYFRLEACSVFRGETGACNVILDLATICWVLGSKTTYSPGDSACRPSIRDLALCKSRTASSHRKFTSSVFSRMSKDDSMVGTSLLLNSAKLRRDKAVQTEREIQERQ